MANYTIAVGWSGKDALADSDAGKVISGADFNTEFSAVRTSINSKADLAGSASQAFSATTANAGTNTTQVASTAFVKAANDLQVTAAIINALVYPVGSIYFNATVATNPATLLGFGTWAAYGAGRVMVGKAGSGTFDTLNETMGAETDAHALTINELPSHNHDNGSFNKLLKVDGSGTVTGVDNSGGEPNVLATGTIAAVGGGAVHTHDIVQPSIVVYMWKRTG